MQGHLADQGVHGARWRGSRRQAALPLGTWQRALVQQGPMPLFHQRCGHLARQLRAQGKHGLGQFLQAGGVLGPVCLPSIHPTGQLCMRRTRRLWAVCVGCGVCGTPGLVPWPIIHARAGRP